MANILLVYMRGIKKRQVKKECKDMAFDNSMLMLMLLKMMISLLHTYAWR